MKKIFQIIVALILLSSSSCSTETSVPEKSPSTQIPAPTPVTAPISGTQNQSYNYLAIGDSYTIGQSVCETCRFPEQFKKRVSEANLTNNYSLKIIAQTGWTTTNLISAINSQNLTPNYDLVTLLIGVNNQFQNKPFSLYEKEFLQLVSKAISLAKGDKTNIIVVSIPDYAYTPYGQGSGIQSMISMEIDSYNTFAKKYCEDNGILFINITDITRQGLSNKNLVAQDGLHPSELAYSLFVDRIVTKASAALHN